jgi:two-component system, OmpR family, copper resistance phosphate regulon response regulator CusR
VLSFDELELDTGSKEVRRGGKPLSLTAKELAVLEYFLKHPNLILSKQAIIDNVWEYDSVITSNNVEVLIRLLRNKIDKPFRYPLIQTYKNLGYKLAMKR